MMPLIAKTKISAAFGVLMTLATVGCNKAISREAVAGSYQLKQAAGTIDLELHLDGTFSETIRPTGAQTSSIRGKWTPPSSDAPQLGIDGLWIPHEFAPDYIREADRSNRDGVKYSDPGYWVSRPSYELGKITIPVFPDADVRFVRMSPSSR